MANKPDFEPHETRRQRATTRPMKLSRPRIPQTITGNLQLPEHIRRLIEDNAQDVADVPTSMLPQRRTPREIDDLKATWLGWPTWDVEFSTGFELHLNELAAWHDDQIWTKARQMGCSHLMASILEELVRCWIRGCPPVSPLAARVLASFS